MVEQCLTEIIFNVTAESVEDLSHPVTKCSATQCDSDDAGGDEQDASHRCPLMQRVDAGAKQPGHDGADCRIDEHRREVRPVASIRR